MKSLDRLAWRTSAVELQKINRRGKRAEKREKEAEKLGRQAHEELGPRLAGAEARVEGAHERLDGWIVNAKALGRWANLMAAAHERQRVTIESLEKRAEQDRTRRVEAEQRLAAFEVRLHALEARS